MKLVTDAIEKNGFFDPRYTCDIDNSSPELRWNEAPDGTRGFAVVFEDLDARDAAGNPAEFPLWVIYNIPPSVLHLPAGIPPQDTLPNGIRQGLNGFGKLGYAGPCPGRNEGPRRYRFRLLVLRDLPDLPARLSRDQLLSAISPLVMTTLELHARYRRIVERAG